MNTPLPTRLRNALAELLLDAIGERGGAGDSRIARDAIALLAAYGDLARDAGDAVPLQALRAGARRIAPDCADDLGAALARLSPEYLELRPGALTADERVRLRDALRPHAARLHAQAAAYTDVLRCAAAAALPHEAAGRSIATAALLFNAGLYFEAHEVLELVWRQTTGAAKMLTQGLLQVAVALHHAHAGNPRGAWTLLRKGTEKLRRTHTAMPALDVATLLTELVPWERHLATAVAEGTIPPRLPSPPQLRFSAA